jgi:hypothetical protein
MTIKKAVNGSTLEFFTINIKNGFPARAIAAMALLGENYFPEKIQELLTKASYKQIMDAAKKDILENGIGATWERFDDACTFNDFSYDMLDTLAKRIVTLSKGVLTYEYMKETE